MHAIQASLRPERQRVIEKPSARALEVSHVHDAVLTASRACSRAWPNTAAWVSVSRQRNETITSRVWPSSHVHRGGHAIV